MPSDTHWTIRRSVQSFRLDRVPIRLDASLVMLPTTSGLPAQPHAQLFRRRPRVARTYRPVPSRAHNGQVIAVAYVGPPAVSSARTTISDSPLVRQRATPIHPSTLTEVRAGRSSLALTAVWILPAPPNPSGYATGFCGNAGLGSGLPAARLVSGPARRSSWPRGPSQSFVVAAMRGSVAHSHRSCQEIMASVVSAAWEARAASHACHSAAICSAVPVWAGQHAAMRVPWGSS